MQFFVYDNDARRYYPRPDHTPAEALSNTDQIETLVANLRRVDIGDIYFDGERGILAHRIRARANLPQYQERNQEHFAVWRTEGDESPAILFEGAAADITALFEQPEWAMPPGPDADGGDYITYPQQVIELQSDATLADIKQSDVSERLKRIKIAADGDYDPLNLGVPSFDHARRLLRLLSETSGTILIGDFNKPDDLERLDPDVIITYDDSYSWLELLDSDTEATIESAKQSLKNKERRVAMDEINEGLRRFREDPTYKARDELAALNRLFPTVNKTAKRQRPSDTATKIDTKTLPDPAQTILAGIRRLHNAYDFEDQQRRSTSQLLGRRRRGTNSPFADVAEKLNTRRETLRETLYERKAESIATKIDEAVADLAVTSEDEATTRRRLFQKLSDDRHNQPEDSRLALVGGGMVAGAVILIILLGITIPVFGIPLDIGIAQQATQPSPSGSTATITMTSELQDDTISVSGESTADQVTVRILNTSSQVLNTTARVRDGQFTVEHSLPEQGSYTIIAQGGQARAENEVLFDQPVQLTLRRPAWGETVSSQQNGSNTSSVVRIAGTTSGTQVTIEVRSLSSESVIQSQTMQPTNGSFTTQQNLPAGTYLVSVTADDHVGANTTVTRPVRVATS